MNTTAPGEPWATARYARAVHFLRHAFRMDQC
jgi:hypothetical protein